MKKEMLINVSQPEECRIAIIEDGLLEELYIERASQDNLVGNIYKGKVVNLEPSIQAAFVDFGVGKQFLVRPIGFRNAESRCRFLRPLQISARQCHHFPGTALLDRRDYLFTSDFCGAENTPA